MIIFWESHNGDRQHWRVNSFDDFSPIAKLFPRVKDIAMASESLSDAINSTVEYLSSGTGEAWTEKDEEVSKALKEAGLALGVALGTLAPIKLTDPINTQQQQVRRTGIPFGQHPSDRFLWNIQQIESSGGKDTNHPVVKYGLSRGDKAIGKWGLLRNTILEMNNRLRAKGKLSKEREDLEAMPKDKLKEHLEQSPSLELEIARQTADHVLRRNKGDMGRAAYSWLHGHNLHPSEIDPTKIMNSDYVSKFKTFDRKNPYAKHKAAKPGKFPATMAKIEPDGDFKGRLHSWLKVRDRQAREPLPRDRTFVPDPGRLREAELDKKPASKANLINYIKELIENAKKAVKS